jgi:hypothetical protein
MWLRKALPEPAPVLAPRTSPATSTKRMVAETIRLAWTISDNTCMRSSGTGTSPTFGSIVAKGSWPPTLAPSGSGR